MSQRDGQRRTEAGHRRRAELMEAAVLLSVDRGFSRTRVSDIVGRVGVGQGVFYWYFESKDALFGEIFEDTTRRMRLFQGAFIADEPDPVRRIAKGIVASFEFIVRNAHVFALLDHATTEVRRQRMEAGRVHVLDTARHFQEAIEKNMVRSTEPMYPARAISGVVTQLARDYFARGGGDLDRVIQEAIDFCLGGLLGPSTMKVAELRAEVDLTPELKRLRDNVGAATDGGGRRAVRSRRSS
jgi:AcrR family transcriptional regulator